MTNYPAATAKWQVSTEGGSKPSWSADGKQLHGAARGVEALGDHIVDFSVARSGRIVAVRELDPGKPPLTIVRNWEQLLSGK